MPKQVTKPTKTAQPTADRPSELKFLTVNQTRKEMVLNNMLGGFSWSIGATVGLAIFIAILGFIAHYVNLIPFFGSFVSHIIDYVLQNNPHFHG